MSVAATQPTAVAAGLEILGKGGNAADAAVAMAAVLNVTEPMSTGVGGDCFALFYNSKTRTVQGINGSGKSPKALTRHHVLKNNTNNHQDSSLIRVIPEASVDSITVPGAAAGWMDTIEWFGSGKLTLADILAPAIRIAEEGFQVQPICAGMWQRYIGKLSHYNSSSSTNADAGGMSSSAPVAGQIVRNHTLATSFRLLASQGIQEAFYSEKGSIAQSIIDTIQAHGGVMTMEYSTGIDLTSHSSQMIHHPLSIEFEGLIVYQCPPNGSGITVLIALGIIKALEQQQPPINGHHYISLRNMQHNSALYLHTLIEILRLSFADTLHHVCDPQTFSAPHLLSPEYLASRALLVNQTSVNRNLAHGSPIASSDTVYLSVVDGEGNACSFINSLYKPFGSGLTAQGTGILLQNRGCNFSLDPVSPNCVDGGKRPYHTIIPSMVTRPNGHLYMSFGVMGGFMQPQGQIQVLLNHLFFNMTPQEALNAPRFCINAIDNSSSCSSSSSTHILLEEGIQESCMGELIGLGHDRVEMKVGDTNREVFGRGQMIILKDTAAHKGEMLGGSDPRGDGFVGMID